MQLPQMRWQTREPGPLFLYRVAQQLHVRVLVKHCSPPSSAHTTHPRDTALWDKDLTRATIAKK